MLTINSLSQKSLPATIFQTPFTYPKAFSLKPQTKPVIKQKNFLTLVRDSELARKEKTKESKASIKKQITQDEYTPHFALYEKTLIERAINFESNALSISHTEPLAALVDSLIDKLGYIFEKGISTTSLFIRNNGTNSLLQSTEVTIKCYDTAPYSFHIDFFTTPTGSQFLHQNLISLSSHLHEAFPESFFSIAKPSLNTYVSRNKKASAHQILRKNEEKYDSF